MCGGRGRVVVLETYLETVLLNPSKYGTIYSGTSQDQKFWESMFAKAFGSCCIRQPNAWSPPFVHAATHTLASVLFWCVCVCVQFSKYTNLVLTLWLLLLIFLFWMFFSLFCLVLSHFSALGSDLVVSGMAFLHQSKLGSTIVSLLSKEMTILWELTRCW